MEKLHHSLRFIRYYLTAGSEHGIHSPFVYDLVTAIIKDATPYYVYEDIEAIRKKMLTSGEEIKVRDFGAGTKAGDNEKRKVKQIAAHSLKSPKYGQLLFRLVRHFKPENILELGTSLGISTMYLAAPSSKATVLTLEGCPEISAVAARNFEKLGQKNIRLITGHFDQNLPTALDDLEKLDFAFLDGNHRKAPTLDYFNQCLQKSHSETVMVIDDIHWSDEMQQAWNIIKAMPEVNITIDLFELGLVFFKAGIEKQDFVLRF